MILRAFRWTLALCALLALSLAAPARAQGLVTTLPSQGGSTHADGSIAVTNTFQSVFTAAGQSSSPTASIRQGCLIQNTGSNPMWIFVGAIASATKNTSFQLVPVGTGVQGGSFSCATGGGGVIQDQVSITGTSGDTFAATSQ